MLTTTFGSSALLGYALISQTFPDNAAALAEAVVISEVGVAPALFTVGVMVAMYYGQAQVSGRERLSAALGYFRSPIFWAMAARPDLFGPCPSPGTSPCPDRGHAGPGGAGHTPTPLWWPWWWGWCWSSRTSASILGLAAAVCVLKLVLKPLHAVAAHPGHEPCPPGRPRCSSWKGPCPRLCSPWPCRPSTAATRAWPRAWCFATIVASAVSILVMFRLLG